MIIADSPEIAEITQAWIRNKSDEAAARNGCRFDWERGAYTVWWIERTCKLYEGSQAGEPMILRGCAECDYGLPVPDEWDVDCIDICGERAARHAECVAAGHRIDWQYDCTMRVFGWVKYSNHWQEWIRRFRKASIWVPKKNKKTPTMSAWGLYLMAGEGEGGQHVFYASKDGSQVKDGAIKHVFAMLDQSEELSAECTLNKTSWQVLHEPTRSTILPMSSSNERTQKSKEGKNGSVMVDETHIVDRKFIKRIDRAGISRKEPLHAEFSTAGDDPDSYGMEQFQKAVKIVAGDIEEEATFAAVYAADQDLKDGDLAADPLKYGRLANPAMGHTVNPEEFIADYEQSKNSPSDLATFKMYRLNVWQNSSSPWLNMENWDLGRRDFTYESMRGRECWSALDLSSVSDFSALCLAFPEGGDEQYIRSCEAYEARLIEWAANGSPEDKRPCLPEEPFSFLWWFWIPEETARANQHKIDFKRWAEDKRTRLTLTDGARVHYGAIRATFRDLAKQYRINELSYDRWNAEQTTQELSEGVTDGDGKVIEPATGIPRVDFSQGIATMNSPAKHFEAAVIDGSVLHTGDPVARWMAQNTTIKRDVNGNYKPIKQQDLSKKIDGTIVAIMARERALLGDGSGLDGYYLKNSLALGGGPVT